MQDTQEIIVAPPPPADTVRILTPILTTAERRTRWLESRRTCITATDVARLFGVGRGGPMAVWLDKTGKTPLEGPDNDAMRFGRRFERPILEEYADRMRVGLTFADSFQMLLATETPLLGATLDARRADDGRPVDAKNIGFRTADYGEPGSDVIPVYYALQLMTQMIVTGAELADLAVLFNRYEFVPYTVRRDADVVDSILTRVEDFWHKHVMSDIPPDVDGSEAYSGWIARRFARQVNKAMVEATPELHAIAVELSATLADIKLLEERAEAARNEMKLTIGEMGALAGPGWKATWTQATSGTKVDWKSVAARLADEIASTHGVDPAVVLDRTTPAYTTTTDGARRFTFTFKGE